MLKKNFSTLAVICGAIILLWTPVVSVAKGPATPQSNQSAYLKELIQKARQKKLAEAPYWKLLLHYHESLCGGSKSDIDGRNFFLSKKGRTDPEAELEATLAAFFEPDPQDPEKEHPQCRFPARYDWLKKELSLDPDKCPAKECPRFESWRSKLNPESLSMIFAGYYMNNPASMYGHTFLKLGRKGMEDGNGLLDYTVNFAAVTNTRNGIAFAVLGLSGGYPGTFSTNPYYMKIQQYNNLESRDIWEYQLRMDPAALDRFVRHLWEMGHTSISYYFLNKNCSYQLLPMLEVADPRYHMGERFRFRAIPLDTLRSVLDQPGLVSGFQFRPSHMRKMFAERALLVGGEAALAQKIALENLEQTGEELNGLPAERRSLVLAASYDLFKYKTGFHRDQPPEVMAQERKILLLMNALPVSSTGAIHPGVNEPPRPECAHGTGRMGFGFGLRRGGSFDQYSVRGAMHDLEDDPTGFVSGSQLDMFKLSLRYDNELGKGSLEELTFVDIKSLRPWDDWVRQPSWALKFGFNTAHDLDRRLEDSNYFGVRGGSGLTLAVPKIEGGMVYGMVEGDGGLGGIFSERWRAGGGLRLGLLLPITRKWRAHINGSFIRYGAGEVSTVNGIELIQAYRLLKSVELRQTFNRWNHYVEGVLSVNYYF